MIKKFSRIAIFTFITLFFLLVTPAFAKTVTLDELGKIVDETVGYEPDYIYVIGNYIFAQDWDLSTQDVMLAARSIQMNNEFDGENKDTALGEMTIYRINREIVNYEPTGKWLIDENFIGSTELKEDDKLDIRYIDYNFIPEDTKINVDLEKTNEGNYKTALEGEKFKFTGGNAENSVNLSLNEGKLTGLIKRNSNEVGGFTGADKTGYYFAFVIEVPNATDATTVEIKGNNTTKATLSDFDEKEVGKEGLAVLWALDPTSNNKIITITVDLDGGGKEYAPVVQTIDWSQVEFQDDSKATFSKQIPQDDIDALLKYGYQVKENEYDLKTDGKKLTLTGTIAEQCTEPGIFAEEGETGYYFAFNIQKPETLQEIPEGAKITIAGQTTNTFGVSNFDANGTFTNLFKLNDKASNNDDKKFTITIDWDGDDGDEYLPTVYEVDYSGVTFEKSSIVTIKGLKNGDTTPFDDDKWFKKEGYYTEFKEETPNCYKVTGLLPIFEDSEWTAQKDPLESNKDNYYLGLLLNLVKADTNSINKEKIDIKFFYNGEEESEFGVEKLDQDFETSKEIYILKYLQSTNETKEFKILIDLDGEGDEYAPWEVTFDYSELKFQKKSSSENVKFNILSSKDLVEDSEEDKELKSYEFDFDTIKGTVISNNGEIEGVIKQQKLKDGTFQDDTGYFVPIKIEFPKDEYPDYENKWVLILNTEDGNKKIYTPSEEEHEQGWALVLFRLNENAQEDEKVIKYSIDFDGVYNEENRTGADFIPFEYEIKYKDLVFETENKVIFEYFDETTGEIKTKEEKIYQNEKIDEKLAPELGTYTYHKFDYWYKSDAPETKFDFSTYTTGKNENITLKAHWTIDVDKFITDVVQELAKVVDYKDVFEVSKEGNTITFNIKDTTTKLSEMDNTSIPGAIAYILQRGEVTGITLSAGNKQVEFTKDGENNVIQTVSLDEEGTALKGKIQAGAKALFEDILGGAQKAQDMTLNKMAVDDQEFTLTIGTLDDSVKLTDGAETKYTFDFATDFTTVKSEEELNAALKNEKVSRIDIAGDFEVTKNVDITRSVTINGGESKHTISMGANAETESTSIFTVKKNAKVTINNIKLKGNTNTKKDIFVESGLLNSTGLEIVIDGDVVPEGLESAIEVGDNSTLTISELTFDKETYELPAVKASKDNATVNLTDKDSKTAERIEKEKITKYEEQKDSKSSTGDIKEVDGAYNYYNYYNKTENSKIYTTTFHNHEARMMATFYRYNYYGEKVQKPYGEDPFKVFKEFNYDGETYTLIGFTSSRDNTIHMDSTGEPLPKDVIGPDGITAKSDERYYVAYGVKSQEGAKKVSDKDQLIAALADSGVDKIFITTNGTIDLSDQDLTISRKLSIVGPSTKVTLKVKNIKVTADDVFLHRLNLEVDSQQDAQALIDISGNASKFTLWQCSLKNTGSQKVNDAIKYSGETAIVDVRWNTFDANNINNTFLNVNSALAGVTDIYGNTFKKLSQDDDNKKSAITIKKFDTTAQINGDDETIRIAANTFDSDNYAIEISEEASGGNQADISLETSKNIEIAVKYDASHKNFKNIKLHCSKDKDKIKIKYIDKDSKATSETLDGGEGVSIILSMEMEGVKLPEQAIINGLEKKGNTYSGIVKQRQMEDFTYQ